ncbi:MAG: hypothetical protein H6832_15165 [Planctomycetes bacterium]|nr:hypothetical protein [Planctomycetota bacterium]
MKTLLASAFVTLTLFLASCGGANAGESLLKTVTDKVGEITTKFTDIKDEASAKTAVSFAESTLPAAKTAFENLKKLGDGAAAPEAVKTMLSTATSKFGDLKAMLSGLAAKFADKADIAKVLTDKLPALLKLLPNIGG